MTQAEKLRQYIQAYERNWIVPRHDIYEGGSAGFYEAMRDIVLFELEHIITSNGPDLILRWSYRLNRATMSNLIAAASIHP